MFVIIRPVRILLEYDHFHFSHRRYAVPGTVHSHLTGWGFPPQAASHNATPECQPHKTHPLPDWILLLAKPLYSHSPALPPLPLGHTHLICLVSLGGLMSSHRLCCPTREERTEEGYGRVFKHVCVQTPSTLVTESSYILASRADLGIPFCKLPKSKDSSSCISSII